MVNFLLQWLETFTQKKILHTLTVQRLEQLLATNEVQQLSVPARERLRWIEHFVRHGGSVSDTCAAFGIARSTFHRWLNRFNPHDVTSLEERAHDPLSPRESTLPAAAIERIRAYREADPFMGKEIIAERLVNEHGMDISASTVGRVIERECLYFGNTPLHLRKRVQFEKSRREEMHAPVIATHTAPPHTLAPAIEKPCTCMWCRMWGSDWKRIRRSIGIGSLVANLAVAAMMFATAYWEKNAPLPVHAELLDMNIQTSSNLDLYDAQ